MKRALDFVLLPENQDATGYFGKADGSRMYGHGIITLALAETGATVRAVEVERLPGQEGSNGHHATVHRGGSATGLSATDAWAEPQPAIGLQRRQAKAAIPVDAAHGGRRTGRGRCADAGLQMQAGQRGPGPGRGAGGSSPGA